MSDTFRDVRYAVRNLVRARGFAAVAIATLALGIGANTAIFSVVRAALWKPLPFPDPDRLVRVTDEFRGQNVSDGGISNPEVDDVRLRSGAFSEISALFPINANLTETDQPERVEALLVDASYFSILGVKAARGRVLEKTDTVPGIALVAVITDSLWKRRYGADPNVVGRHLRLDMDPYTIVGVLPEGFHHPGRGLQGEAELFAVAGWRGAPFPQPLSRRGYFLSGAIARLKPGVTLGAARSRLAALSETIRGEFPADYPAAEGWSMRVVPLHDDLVGSSRPALLILFAAVALVLSIACANVANLLLARAAGREREIAIRRALGAGRARLVRQLLTESVLLAGVGAGAGLLLCAAASELLVRLTPAGALPRGADVRVDLPVLAFTSIVAIAAGLLFGLVPALHASSGAFGSGLAEASRGSSASSRARRLRSALVVSEFALALVLLAGAALTIRSLARLQRVDPGFDPERVLTSRLWLPQPNEPKSGPYFAQPKRAAVYRAIFERFAALPGVQAAGGVNRLPFASPGGFTTYMREGSTSDSDARSASASSASPGYFAAMGIPLREGRVFADSDGEEAPPVAVVSESLAKRDFPGSSAVGRRIRLGGAGSTDKWMTIVGVVGDVRLESLESASRPQLYRCLWQTSGLALALVVRTSGDPRAIGGTLAREIRAVDPDLPLSAIVPMEEVVQGGLAPRRFAMRLLVLFAAVAMALAAIGIYGVIAYAIELKRRELGIRVALGATPRDVLALVLGDGARLIGAGVVCGLAAAVVSTRGLSSLLFEVSARDPLVLAAISALLALVAFAACVVPARRAAKLDPVDALRAD